MTHPTRDQGAEHQPQRIQRRRTAGWRMPAGALYVGRPTRFGNPFPIAEHGPAAAVALYRTWLTTRPDLVAAVRAELAGRDLACWCPPQRPCHADVLLALARTKTTAGAADTAAPPAVKGLCDE
jgi:hypothetical protein